jgi:hypothetical protein
MPSHHGGPPDLCQAVLGCMLTARGYQQQAQVTQRELPVRQPAPPWPEKARVHSAAQEPVLACSLHAYKGGMAAPIPAQHCPHPPEPAAAACPRSASAGFCHVEKTHWYPFRSMDLHGGRMSKGNPLTFTLHYKALTSTEPEGLMGHVCIALA